MLANDFQEFEKRLKRLQKEINTLEKVDPMSEDFVVWHGKLSSLIVEAFGDDSIEIREFGNIRLEPPGELIDLAENCLDEFPGDILNKFEPRETDMKNLQRATPHLSHSMRQQWFRKRLYDYDELITMLIYSLRK